MKKNKAMQLVKVLRSGTYEQGRGILVDENDCFCIMGVVCNESKADLEWEQRLVNVWTIGNEFFQLPEKIQEEYGFYNQTGRRSDGEPIKIKGKYYVSLMSASDSGVPFKDIANYIEKNYKDL
jgi:hypothetical protein